MTAEMTAVIVSLWLALFVAAWVWAVREEGRRPGAVYQIRILLAFWQKCIDR